MRQTQTKQARLQDACLSGILDPDAFASAKRSPNESEAAIRQELSGFHARTDDATIHQTLRSSISAALATLRSAEATLEQKNTASRFIIETCTFDKATSTLSITYRVIFSLYYSLLIYGGPDGELGASLRYLSQRFSMPYPELKGLLTDIGTEELGHLEMIGAIVHQLTRNLTDEQIKTAGFDTYFVDRTTGVYPTAASGFPYSAASMACKGDLIADLTEDLAADGAMVEGQPDKIFDGTSCFQGKDFDFSRRTHTGILLPHYHFPFPVGKS